MSEQRIVALAIIGCIATLSAFGAAQPADKYVQICTKHPGYCQKHISPLADAEKASLQKARADYDAAARAFTEAAKRRDAAMRKIVEAHGMKDYPAVLLDTTEGLGGGTCLGSISVVDDSQFLLYAPSDEIQTCEETANTNKTAHP